MIFPARWMRPRRGGLSVLFLVSLLAVMGIAGLAVDGGRLYVEKQRAQNAADAAAMAGSMDLPNQTKAEASARRTSTANGYPTPEITFAPYGNLNPGLIRVRTERVVPLIFASVLGQKNGRVTGGARVSTTPPANKAWGVLPWGIQMESFNFGQQVTLKLGSQSNRPQPGNFECLALGGTGADRYELNLANGFSPLIKVGDLVITETGNMMGPTNSALQTRFSRAASGPWGDDTYANYDPGNPRIGIIPLVDWSQGDPGRTGVPLLGFGAFWIDNYQSGGGGEITGRFIKYVSPGDAEFDPTVPPGIDGGVYGARLDD